jgi:hypothetical protein
MMSATPIRDRGAAHRHGGDHDVCGVYRTTRAAPLVGAQLTQYPR